MHQALNTYIPTKSTDFLKETTSLKVTPPAEFFEELKLGTCCLRRVLIDPIQWLSDDQHLTYTLIFAFKKNER